MRKTGLAKADKKAARVAAEGTVVVERAGTSAVLVEVNCETDFVAASDEFQAFARDVAQAALSIRPPSLPALLAEKHGAARSEERRRALIAKIGENISVRRFMRVTAPGPLGTYMHGARIGSWWRSRAAMRRWRSDLAMHVAASNPALHGCQRGAGGGARKEREILTEQTKGEKKPPEIIAKMVEGRLRKYLAEITLLGQPFVKDPDITVEKLLKKSGAKVVQFVRYEVGAGIEKKQDDFVSEVMAQVRRRTSKARGRAEKALSFELNQTNDPAPRGLLQ